MEYQQRNLPVYVYAFDVQIALVLNGKAYLHKYDKYSPVTIKSNQPLMKDMSFTTNCCGTENVKRILDWFSGRHPFYKANLTLKHWNGFKVTDFVASFVEPDNCSPLDFSGYGICTLYVQLTDSNLHEEYQKLNDVDSTTIFQKLRIKQLRDEITESQSLEYWINRIQVWNDSFIYIGEQPALSH